MLTDTRNSPYARIKTLPWDSVSWEKESFWEEVFRVCSESTVRHIHDIFEDTEISHVVENFKIAANEHEGDHKGTPFGDGDFYKWMEAAVYIAAKNNDAVLMADIDDYIELIRKAQQPDGYISTKQIIGERNKTGKARLGDINDFEVYNFGHLFTAACIHKRITGKTAFMDIALLAADFLENMYMEAAKTGVVKTAVCPSHYMGLVEMFRTIGDKRYLELAKLSISLRDSVKNGTDDNQDRIPLKKHEKIVGHAVRANYLYAGTADLYVETGDIEYKEMLDKVWADLTESKIYITGGCGALYNGVSPYGNFWVDRKIHQAYGHAYQLPNLTAYNETCAAIGCVLWAYRMFNAEPKAEYFDIIERCMLNTNLAAVSLDGRKYFYQNALRREKELPFNLCWPLERTEYISSFCCPPNITRILSETSEYAYAVSEDMVYTGLYGASSAVIKLECGTELCIKQETDYPWDGVINFSFNNIINGTWFKLAVRIPSWAESGNIKAGGKEWKLTSETAGSYIEIPVNDPYETTIVVCFDMPVRYTAANSLSESTTNQTAIERGPLVYCTEGCDAGINGLENLMLKLNAGFETVSYEIAGRRVIALEGEAYSQKQDNCNKLYRTLKYSQPIKTFIRMIPYFAWDNRGRGEMKVWLPVAYEIYKENGVNE